LKKPGTCAGLGSALHGVRRGGKVIQVGALPDRLHGANLSLLVSHGLF